MTEIILKLLTPDDVTDQYVTWMADPEVTKFLECRYQSHSIDDIRKFVRNANEHDYLFGIFLPGDHGKTHIGNVKIGNVHHIHQYAEIGIMIGDRSKWGKGYGGQALRLAVAYAFNELNLLRLTTTVYADNTRSYNALVSVGFTECGRMKDFYYRNGKRDDIIMLEILRDKV